MRSAGAVMKRTLVSFYDDQMTHHAAALTYYSPAADFRAAYGAAGPRLAIEHGSLERWLTERYCVYVVAQDGAVSVATSTIGRGRCSRQRPRSRSTPWHVRSGSPSRGLHCSTTAPDKTP
jgi:2-methylaconitate cis-trans-isomerase PrpF